jgi:protocatechuate 3,4-dioxygenase beta subunit
MTTWWKRGLVIAVALTLLLLLLLGPGRSGTDGEDRTADTTGHEHGKAATALRGHPSPARLPRAFLRGKVIDGTGTGIEGATIVIVSAPAGERALPLAERTATAGPNGVFTLPNLLIGTYRVEARHTDRVSATATTEVRAAGGEVVLVLVPAATLVVEVHDAASDAPIANATVRVALGNPDLGPVEAFIEGRTGANGEATFRSLSPTGRHQILAEASGYLFVDRNLHPLEYPRREQWRVRLLLERGVATIHGRVLDRQGAPVPGAKLGWKKGDPDDLLSQAIDWLPDPRLSGRKLSDEAGRFSIQVAPGAGCLDAIPRDHEIGHACLVVSEGGTYEADVIVEDGAELTGTVVQDDVPVAGATVFLTEPGYVHQPWLEPVYRSRTQTDGNGRFRFRGLGEGALAAYAYTADASSDLIPIQLNQASELVIRLENSGVITGRVIDSSGKGVPSAIVTYFATANPEAPQQLDEKGQVVLPPEFSMARTIGGVVADPEGNFRITALPASLRFSVAANPPSASSVPPAYAGVYRRPVAAGDRIELTLRGEGAVHGRVVFDDGTPVKRFGVSFAYYSSSGTAEGEFPSPHIVTAADGRFAISEVTAVDYALEVTGDDLVSHRIAGPIKVTGGQDLDLGTIVVSRGRARIGRVRTEAGQPAEGAKVLIGRGQPERYVTVHADAKGEFQVPAMVADQKVRIRAELDELVSDWSTISATGNVVLVVGRTAMGTVVGMVIDNAPTKQRVALLTPVGAGEPLDGLPVIARTEIDDAGKFQLTVAPGQYQCWVRRDLADRAGVWWNQTIQVLPGKETNMVAALQAVAGGR